MVLLQVTLTKLPSLPPHFQQTKAAQKELLLASESFAASKKVCSLHGWAVARL